MSVLLCGWSDKNFEVGNQLATWWPWAGEKNFFEFCPFSCSAAISAHFTAEPKNHSAPHFFEIFFFSAFATMYKLKHMWNPASHFSIWIFNNSFLIFAFWAYSSKNLLKRVVWWQISPTFLPAWTKIMSNLPLKFLSWPFHDHLWIDN